eukprot:s1725_g10.t1
MLNHYMSRIHFVTKSPNPKHPRHPKHKHKVLAFQQFSCKQEIRQESMTSWSYSCRLISSTCQPSTESCHNARAGSRWGPSEMRRQDMAHQSPVAEKLCFSNLDRPP